MAAKHPTVVITGAGGFLGANLATYFSDKDWRVLALVRDPSKYKDTKNIHYEAFDLAKPFDDALFKGADYLVHAAYIKFDHEHPDAFQQNLKGTKRLLAASRKHKLKQNLFMSTMSAHEAGMSIYAKQKLAVEGLFNQKNDTIFSSGLIIGNGGLVKQMADFMKAKGMVPLIGGGKQPLQVIGIYDLERLIELALTKGKSGKFTTANPTVYQYKEFYATLGKHLDISLKFIPMPYFVLATMLSVADLLHVKLSASKENLDGLKCLVAVDNREDLDRLGVTIDDLPTALSKTEGITG